MLARAPHIDGVSGRRVARSGIRRRPSHSPRQAPVEWEPGRDFRLLLIVHPKCRKVAKTIRCLLGLHRVRLTVVADGDPEFRQRIQSKLEAHRKELWILARTGRTDACLRWSHLVLTPGEGEMVRAALAAGRPVIAVRTLADWLGDAASQLGTSGIGAVAGKSKDAARLVRSALKHRGYLYRRWLRRLERLAEPATMPDLAQSLQ